MPVIKSPLGSIVIAHQDKDGPKVLRAAIATPAHHGFIRVSTTRLMLSGMPLSVYFSESLGMYSLAVVLVTAVEDNNEFFMQGTPFQTRITTDSQHVLEIDEAVDSLPAKETIVAGLPMAVNTNDDLIFIDHLISGDPDEEADVFIGGMPLLCRRFGDDWFLACNVSSTYASQEDAPPEEFEWFD